MSQILRLLFNQGHNSSSDPAALAPGECQRTVGIWYPLGDTERAWKVPGRALFGDTASAAKIKGLALAKFDSGSDLLLALSGTTLYSATPGTSGTWSSLITGLSSSASFLSRAHYSDRHYLVTGYDRMRVVESGAVTRNAGIDSPQEAPTLTPAAVASSLQRPTANSGTGFTNPANARDTSMTTFASATMSAAGTKTTTWTTFGSDTTANRQLKIRWRLVGAQPDMEGPPEIETGGSGDSGFDVTVKLEYSVNSGSAWTTLAEYKNLKAVAAAAVEEVAAISANSNLVHVRATLTYNSGTSSATVRIYDIQVSAGSTVANFDATLDYAFVWIDANRSFGGQPLQGPLGPNTQVTLAAQNTVGITRSVTDAEPTNITHWGIYRNTKGGSWPQTAGLIARVPVAQTSFTDDFTRYDASTQPVPLIPIIGISVGDDPDRITVLRVPRDSPPPLLEWLTTFKGSLVGGRGRAAFYSIAGRPESWPEIYLITSFPMDEHDTLVAGAVVGDYLLFAAQDLMMVTTDLPRVVQGRFSASEITPLRGAPGCVGPRALTVYSMSGEPRAAWVSYFGIHETNGSSSRRLTNELDWAAELARGSLSSAALTFNPEDQTLRLDYDSDGGGTNDRYALVHMAPEHEKASGLPKITWGHYAKASALVGGVISGRYRLYSGHVSDGKVYLEGNAATTDASNAYDGFGTVPVDVLSARVYAEDKLAAFVRASLRHSAAGAAQTANLTVTAGRGNSQGSSSTTESVSIASSEATDFYIGRAGEWAEARLVHTGSAIWAFRDLRFEGHVLGRAGKVAI